MLVDLISLVGIAFIQICRSKDSTVFSLSNAVVSLAYGGSIVSAWYEAIRRIRALIIWSENSKYALYLKAAGFIFVRYATLVAVNPRYTGTYIIVIVMLVFIGAVCIMDIIIISPKNSKITPPKRNKKKKKKKEAHIISRGSEEYGNDGAADAVRNYADDTGLFLTVLLPSWILCLMKADSLVISQFLLFLSCSMGELTRMMASVPSERAAPAFEVLHKGSVVVVLLTGHTMAAEALGLNHAVLAVTPELVAILVWFTFQLGYGGNFTARFFADRRLRLFPDRTKTMVALLSIVVAFLAAYISLMIELEATNLLWSYYDLFVAWFYSVVLPFLFAVVLRQCWRKTNKANLTPSEVEGAIQVLFCFSLHVFVGGLLVLFICWLRLELVQPPYRSMTGFFIPKQMA